MNPLKLARPKEIPLLRLAGYEVIGNWNASFVLLALSRETKSETESANVGATGR